MSPTFLFTFATLENYKCNVILSEIFRFDFSDFFRTKLSKVLNLFQRKYLIFHGIFFIPVRCIQVSSFIKKELRECSPSLSVLSTAMFIRVGSVTVGSE